MTLQELQQQALQLPTGDRWQLVQTLLDSLQQETRAKSKRRNLSQLRGIAQNTAIAKIDSAEDYANYLTEKYR